LFKHILIPTDGSALSEKAVEVGLGVAKSWGAHATLLTVSPPFHIIAAEAFVMVESQEEYVAAATAEANAVLKSAFDRAQSRGVDAECVHVFQDHAYQAIIEIAEKRGGDLIVMASHGRRGIAALLLGSETSKVLTHTKIPVLVCR
jgi:nucleotide-binding universal stress UspA family protein